MAALSPFPSCFHRVPQEKSCDGVHYKWPGRHQTLPLLRYSTPLPNPFINILLKCVFPAAYHPRSSEKSCNRTSAHLCFGSTWHSSRSTWHFKGHEQTDLNAYLLAEARVISRRPPPARLIIAVVVVVVVVEVVVGVAAAAIAVAVALAAA